MNQRTYKSEWFTVRSILGCNWAKFFIILGAREAGKSYSILDQFLRDFFRTKYKKGFCWLRLTEASTKKLLSNNAMELVDTKLREKYRLNERLVTKGTSVFYKDDNGDLHLMAKVLALSTFYSDKGVALFKDQKLEKEFNSFNIILDEFQRERNEKNTFDITYAFKNQLENLIRSRSDVRIVMIGNTVEEASDLLTLFNFIPESFGRFYLKKYGCVIYNAMPNENYLNRRSEGAMAFITREESTFTNKRELDFSLINKRRRIRPTNIIIFDSQNKFTIWDHNIIAPYNGENISSRIYMRPLIGGVYNLELVTGLLGLVYNRTFGYVNLITQKKFEKNIKLIKGIK